jgi:FMN reductase
MSIVGDRLKHDDASTRPLIVGIGGTTRPGSSSERALRASLAAAQRAGADIVALTGHDLILPMYSPGVAERDPGAMHLIDLIRRCDGLIISSPGYHGSLSGMIKNALDYVEDLREEERPYLEHRAVGCIVCAAGWQAVGTTLTALRAIVHALRGWPTPMGAGFNTADPAFDLASFSEAKPGMQLEILGQQVAQFARMRRAMEGEAALMPIGPA